MAKPDSKTEGLTGYVVFLRGINVGGNKIIKMDDLKKVFESMGFKKVKTILASGNVLFQTPEKNATSLKKSIEKTLEEKFGHTVEVMIRSIQSIQKLVEHAPFKKITVTPQTRLYVTFLSQKPTGKLKIPYETPEKDYKILSVSETEVCSVLTILPDRGTPEAMKILEKEFSKNITTRNWNTVLKIVKYEQ